MKTLVFTGAGIGVPLGLPTTTEFTDILSKGHGSIRTPIYNHLGDEKNDIEKVLSVLEEFVDNSGFISRYIENNGNNSNFREVGTNIKSLQNLAREWTKSIKTDLFKILQNYDISKAYQLYSNIIKEIKSIENGSVSFFTTNYDLTFEDSIFQNKSNLKGIGIDDVLYGFETELGKSLFNKEQNFEWKPSLIEYLKLHGSLDWVTDGTNCAKSGAISLPAVPEDMPLLYPGYKGTPQKEPFISIHERLYSRLIQADLLIVLGFAFRDPYINNVLEFGFKANKKLKILVYNPCDIDKFPKDSKMGYLVEQYINFQHVKVRIEVIENPLDLRNLLINSKSIKKQI